VCFDTPTYTHSHKSFLWQHTLLSTQLSLAQSLEQAIEEQFNACPLLSSMFAPMVLANENSSQCANVRSCDDVLLSVPRVKIGMLDDTNATWATLLRSLVECATERIEQGQTLSVCVEFDGEGEDEDVQTHQRSIEDTDVDMEEESGSQSTAIGMVDESAISTVGGAKANIANKDQTDETNSPNAGASGSGSGSTKTKKRGRQPANSKKSQPRRSSRRTGSSRDARTSARSGPRREILHEKLWQLLCKYKVVKPKPSAADVNSSSSQSASEGDIADHPSASKWRSFPQIASGEEEACASKYSCFATVYKTSTLLRESEGVVAGGRLDSHSRREPSSNGTRNTAGATEAAGVGVNTAESAAVREFIKGSCLGQARQPTVLLSVLLDAVVHIGGLLVAGGGGSAQCKGKVVSFRHKFAERTCKLR
jgi:hypothetical protein